MTAAVLKPGTVADVQDAIRDAVMDRVPLAIEGGGGLSGLGRPMQTERTLKLDGLTGVVEYSPSELYATFRAGETLADARAALAEKRQRLPFDPPDLTGLYGDAGGLATMGGVVAAALSGPSRVAVGAARDYVVGVGFVDGQGQALKGGGRVMKNVTGYDLCKLTTGAFGTLGAITDATFKVLPFANSEVTLLAHGLDDAAAQAMMSAAFKSPFEPVGAAHLPATAAAAIGGVGGAGAVTALRLEGFPDSLDYRTNAIRSFLPAGLELTELEAEPSAAFWEGVRDVAPFQAPDPRALWRISTAPTQGPKLVAEIAQSLEVDVFYDWAGGLIWLAVAGDAPNAGADVIRPLITAQGGHGTLMRADQSVRAVVEVFEPLAAPLLQLTQGLKRTFDPFNALNAGHMYAAV